jgi:hypothetical protein
MLKKTLFLLITFILIHHILYSQQNKIRLASSIQIAIGDFSVTHIAGLNADILFVKPDSTKNIRIVYKAGITYFFGKNQITSGYDYKYPGYLNIEAAVGLRKKMTEKINLQLTAGPAIGFYNQSTRFILVSELTADYKLNEKFLLGPLVKLLKETGANALWIAGVKIQRKF